MPRLTDPTTKPKRGRGKLASVPDPTTEEEPELFPEGDTEETEPEPERVETPASKAVAKAAASRLQRRRAKEATETPQEEPEAEDPTDTAPEPENATEVPAEPTDGKEKPKGKRRARLTPVATPANVQVFKPDFSKLVPLEERHDYIRAILYGDGGVGKTTSVASLAERGLVIFVDPENSVRPKALRQHGVKIENIMLWPDWSYEGLEQLYVTAKAKLEEEPGSIFAISIDTTTALASYWLEDAVEASLAKPSNKRNNPTRTQWDVYQDDYGVLTQQMQSLITRKLYQLPCHIVLTAHARRGENEDGLIRVGPALSPAASQALFTYSDWVLRMTMGEKNGKVTRGLETSPRGQVEAKDRFGVLDEKMSYHNMLELLEIWEMADGDE